jgi:hypothetical protein
VQPLSARVGACVFDADGMLLDPMGAVTPNERAVGGLGFRLPAMWQARQYEHVCRCS